MHVRALAATLAMHAAMLMLLGGCGDPADALFGRYIVDVDSHVSATRSANRRPDGAGGFVADMTHFNTSSSRTGVEVDVRVVGRAGGHRTFEAAIPDLCTVQFQLLDDSTLSDNAAMPTCRCMLDAPVEGPATVHGTFRDGELSIEISVALPGPDHGGGCTHSIRGRHR